MTAKQPPTKHLFEAWANVNEFSLIDAAALWVGESPPHNFKGGDKMFGYDPIDLYVKDFNDVHTFRRMYDRMSVATELGELEAIIILDFEVSEEGRRTYSDRVPHPFRTKVERKALKKWAESEGLYPDFLYSKEVQAHHYHRILTLCLDDTQPFHSKELAIAIRAWEHVYINGEIYNAIQKEGPGVSHKSPFKEYINDNFRYSEDGWYEIFSGTIIGKIIDVAHADERKEQLPKKLKKQHKIDEF